MVFSRETNGFHSLETLRYPILNENVTHKGRLTLANIQRYLRQGVEVPRDKLCLQGEEAKVTSDFGTRNIHWQRSNVLRPRGGNSFKRPKL